MKKKKKSVFENPCLNLYTLQKSEKRTNSRKPVNNMGIGGRGMGAGKCNSNSRGNN